VRLVGDDEMESPPLSGVCDARMVGSIAAGPVPLSGSAGRSLILS
jgi:hypothetical protein